MSPRTFLSMRAVGLALIVSTALVASSATSSLSAAGNDIDSARARLEGLRSDLQSVSARYAEARDELVHLDKMMDVRIGQVQRRARSLIGFEKDAEALAVELYMSGSSVGAIEGVLASETLAEMDRTTAYLEFTGEDQRRVIERFVRDSAELERELDALDQQRAQAQETLEELENIRAEVAADAAQVQNEIDQIEADEAAERAAALAAEREAARAAAAEATEIVNDPSPVSTAPVPAPSSEADWEAIAMCESGGNWHIDSTYDGGLQFHPNTWLAYGGGKYARYAWQATKEQQIAIAEKVLAGQGPGAWPHCFKWK